MTTSSMPTHPNKNASPQPTPYESLTVLLRQLNLTHLLDQWDAIEHQATQQNWSYGQFLLELCHLEAQRREQLRLQRSLSEAQLPVAKSFTNFEFAHCPNFNPAPLMQLAEDTLWLARAQNCILLGASGVGKTHLAASLARRCIELGKRAKFFAATALVQQLQDAKLQLQLHPLLKKLDRYDLLVLDDLGYVKKNEAETSVLFELIAHRYERKSLLITANQPFSQWDNIFSDSMMTIAAIDRLVHHGVIIDVQAQSYRKSAATERLTPSSPTSSKANSS